VETNAALLLLLAIAFSCCLAGPEETGKTPPLCYMQEAVRLAPKHHHDIRIASYTVEEKQHAKDIAKSSYPPPSPGPTFTRRPPAAYPADSV
jgi:hypothetical protein